MKKKINDGLDAFDGFTVDSPVPDGPGPTSDGLQPGDGSIEWRQATLAIAMRSSGLGAWAEEVKTDRVWWSEELEEIFGIQKGSFGGTEAHFFALMHEDDQAAAGSEISSAIAEHRPFQFYFRFFHADGSVRWMEARGQAVYSDNGEAERLYGVGIDITGRRAADERASFLARLAQAVQPITVAADIMSITARMLGDFLAVDRCAYAEVENESTFVITGDHTRGVPSIVGRWEVEAFGSECLRQMLANEAYVVEDSDADPRITGNFLDAYRATNIVAVICVPLHKDGVFTAAMAVHQKTPRKWSAGEIELVQNVVSRCWESLERSRAARAAIESDERFRLALASGAVTVYEQDRDLRYKWLYPVAPFGSHVIGKTDDELSADNRGDQRTQLKNQVIETGIPVRGEVSATVMGRERWYDLLIEPRLDAQGDIIGVGGAALDITDRKEAEFEGARLQQKLAESEAQFRGLMEQAPFSIQLFDPSGRHTRVNRAWEKLWGLGLDAIPDYNILEDPQLEQKGIASVIRRAFDGEPVEIPAIEYDPDETLPGKSQNEAPSRWISAIAYPLKTPEGDIREVALIHQDMTEKRRADEALVFQKTLLEALIESVLDGILILSPKGEMLHSNRRFIEIWGFPPEVLQTRSDQVALEWAADQTADPAGFLARVSDIYDDPEGVAREEVLMKDGRVFERYGAPVYDGKSRLGWVWTFRDISDSKIAEAKLRDSENNLRSLADTIPQLAWMADPEGTVFWYNKGWYDYTGMSRETSGDGDRSEYHDPEHLERVTIAWRESISTGEPFEMEFPLRGSNGKYCWFLTRVNPLRDAQGNIIRWFGTNTDITKIREIEEELRIARDDLETRVIERTRELADVNAKLRTQMHERDRAERERIDLLKRLFTIQEDERGRIARDIHDQLGQRVTALRLKTASIMELCEPGSELARRAGRLQEIALHLDHEVSFVSWELRPSILDDLDFGTALDNYIQEWTRHSQIAAEFHTSVAGGLAIDDDAQINLYRILQEALNNAAKHSGADKVSVLLEQRGRDLILIIEDNGVGLGAGIEHADNGTRQKLGLIGMRERALLIGGSIEFETGDNGGTVIFVRVPMTGGAGLRGGALMDEDT
jgi:PAS domain S-box-containing protein